MKKRRKKELELKAYGSKARQKPDIAEILACLLLTAGYVKAAASGFPSVESYGWVYAGVCGLLALLLAASMTSRHGKWVWPGILAVAVLTVLFGKRACGNGLGILGNDVLTYLTGKTGKIYLDFFVTGDEGKYLVPALGFGVLTLVISGLCYWKKRFFLGLLTVLYVAGYACGFLKPDGALILIAVGILQLELCRYGFGEKKGKAVLTVVGVLVLVFLCVLPAFWILDRQDYKLSFSQEQHQWKYFLHKTRYDGGTDAMPEGNLVNIGAFERSQEEALKLKMEEPGKLYLRGMTGEIYTGSSWDGFDSSVYQENQDLFYWLHKESFYGETMLAAAEELMPEPEKAQTLEITNISACKEHLYLPYALADSELLDADEIGDNRTYGRTGSVKLTCVPGSLPQWYQTARWLTEHQKEEKAGSYLKKEESYRNFVYEKDLQLTNSAVGALERILGKEGEREKSLSEILDLVRETLDETLTYDESVITYNGNNDFITYTLEQSKRGYSPHYATVATLMLRYLGVPARYVEGYFLSEEKAEALKGQSEVLLTEADAHAWTEIYLDGVGWLPFEVTPGYIDDEEWEETGAVIADGLGEGAGRAFLQSTLTYTPPKLPEQNTSLPDLRSMFRFEVRKAFYGILFFLLLLLVWSVCRILRRHRRLRRFWKKTKEAENRKAVEELYGYADMLQKKCGLWIQEGRKEAGEINERARFSQKKISDGERDCMEAYAFMTVRTCKEQNGFWKHIRYHYILWLY